MKLRRKTSKSALKRFKISARGKVSHRAVNMNHFNAKDSGNERRRKRGQRTFDKAFEREVQILMPYKSIAM